MIRRITAGVIGLMSVGAGVPAAADAPAFTELPAEWRSADFGIPCTWAGHDVVLYADIATGDGRFARNAAMVDDRFLIQPIDTEVPDTFYWMTDCTELPDGTLLVAALEVINRHDLPQDGWQFEIVDTDLFVVRDPTSPKSWEIASKRNKLEDGWWDAGGNGMTVEFDDQWPAIAFARATWGDLLGDRHSYVIDPATGMRGARLPESDGVFAPVQTAHGWFGYSWDWETNTATLWSTDVLGNDWTEGDTITYDDQTHAHGLNVIDGEIVHRWSTIRNRPQYEEFNR